MTKKRTFPATLVRAGNKAFQRNAMTKKISTVIFCLALALNLAAQTSGTTGNCTWTLTGSGSNLTLTISGNGAMGNHPYGSNVAPWYSQRANIKTVVIGNAVTTIGKEAFRGCTGLTSITISNSVTTIGEEAFFLCSGLTSVTIPNSVTTIEYGAFTACSSLTSVTIPNRVTHINQFTFYQCGKLTSITIPNSVTTIDIAAFSGCTSLTSITIPQTITSIGYTAFMNCTSLTTVNFNATNCTSGGFAVLENLTTVNIGNNVTRIPDNAFGYCTGLTSITIPNSVKTIGERAFFRSGLTSVTIPNSVTHISEGAFEGCTGLNSITIPNSVTSISDYAFYGCTGLTDVTVNWATPLSIFSGVFEDVTLSNVNLHIPDNACALYATAPVWRDFNFSCGSQIPQTITFNVLPAKTYGDANFTLSATASSGLAVTFNSSNTSVATVSGNTVTIKGAGTANITASQSGNANFTAATPVTRTLTVSKALLAVIAENKSRIYGVVNPALTYSISGFKNSETQSVIDVLPTVSTTATPTSNVGNYAITVQNASDNNYDFGYQNGTLTIGKAPQTITFISGISIKKYGDTPFTIAQTSSGLPPTILSSDPSKLVVANNTAYIVGTGTFALTASQSGNINYLPAPDAVTTVTVSKAPLIITANDAVRKVGEANPQFTLSYSGFKNGENEGVLDLLPTASCPANETSPAGNYVITLSGGNDNNYIYTLVNGKLTVEDVTAIKNVVAGQLQIYPNPAKEDLFIKSDLQIQKVEIYALSGVLLLSENNFNEKISVSALPSGVYLLKVYTDKGIAVSKIVKE